jgi:23S rRNA (guanosine2251-2'-O)-methyltransferase
VIVYGRNAVREALRGRRTVQRVFATERAAREVWLGGVETVIEDQWQIEERCGSPDHQGLCAEVGPYPYADADSLLDPGDALVLALDEVQDPHNLGAIARVAESAGCTGVVLPERRSAEVTPAVCRASAGAVEHLDIARVGNLAS